MNKQIRFSRIQKLSRRARIFSLIGVAGLLLAGCGITSPALSGNSKNQSTSAVHPSVTSAAVSSTPTATFVPTVPVANTPTDTPAPTATATEAPLPTPLPVKLNSCLPDSAKVELARVVKVINGDTIEVSIEGAPFTVHYIGIDAPETQDPNAPVQDYGPEAAQRNTNLVADQQVTLVKDVSETDPAGRLLRYVFVDGLFVNETLIKEGYARATADLPDSACQALFTRTEEAAKAQAIGLWSAPASKAETIPTLPPTEAPTLAPTLPLPAASGCPQGCTEQQPGCDIKGNINTSGEKIYHTPGSSSYAKTKIDPSNGERWFCTVDEAVSNGWRAPRN